MPFVENPLQISEDWQYYNKRIAEMGLVSNTDIDAHKIQFCPPAALVKFGIRGRKYYQNRPAILFEYLNELGHPQGCYHARMIGDHPDPIPPRGMTLEQWDKFRKEAYPKYLSGGTIDAYFPPLATGWMNQPVVFITEGIPKAIRMTKAGLPCISIQGKDMYRIKGTTALVPALQRFLPNDTLQRVIYVADSDANKRDDIRSAAVHFVGMMNGTRQSREFASYLIVPDVEGFDKTGIDDYLNTQSVEAFMANYKNWIHKWEGGTFFELMDKLNAKLCSIRNTTNYINLETLTVIKSSVATKTVQPILSSVSTIINPYSGSKIRGIALSTTFDSDPFRNECDGVDFWPGMPATLPNGFFNLWRDAAPVPLEGDISPFLNLIQHTIPDERSRELLFSLISHRCQFAAEPCPLIIFLHGPEGTGKSSIAKTLFSAITTNPDYTYLGGVDFGYQHEARHVHKQAVCLEEPTKSGMTNKDMESKLKLLGDGDDLYVNPKGIDGYLVKNRMLLWINSNDSSLPISGTARRWLIMESAREARDDLTRACRDWWKSEPNFGAMVLYWILANYPKPIVRDIQLGAATLESKAAIVQDNKPELLMEFEQIIDELPDELKAFGVAPTSLMYKHPIYSTRPAGFKQQLAKLLVNDYPIVKANGSVSQDGKVIISSGVLTTFRSIDRGVSRTYDSGVLREIYAKWEKYAVNFGRKF
jgi:hypothetical protein